MNWKVADNKEVTRRSYELQFLVTDLLDIPSDVHVFVVLKQGISLPQFLDELEDSISSAIEAEQDIPLSDILNCDDNIEFWGRLSGKEAKTFNLLDAEVKE